MKYFLDVKIEPNRHYIHVKGKIENAINNTFYLNENFNMLHSRADNVDIGFKMDKAAPHPEFDPVSRPVIFDTKSKNIEFEYEGYILESIGNINRIDEGLVELASYSGWYPKPMIFGTTFDFDIKLSLPFGYELAANGMMYDHSHFISTDGDNYDIAIFASNRVKRVSFDEDTIKLTFLCPDEMLSNISNRAKNIVKANSYFTEKYGEIQIQSAKKEVISVFGPRGDGAYKRGNTTFMSYESSKNETNHTIDFHELAHGWWVIANGTTDDWINEAGAEFSAYAASKYIHGSEFAENLINNYIEEINKFDNEESIIDTTPTSPNRGLNLYIKPTIMFVNAMKYFGEDRVFSLLKALYNKYARTRNATAEGFLDLCEPDMKTYFEKLLFAKGWKDIEYKI